MKMFRSFATALAGVTLFSSAALAGPGALSGSIPLRVIDGASPVIDQIVNGSLETAQPSVVLIRDQTGALCTGTLIGCRHVLTAASCFCSDPATGTDLPGSECANNTALLNPANFQVFFQHAGSFGVEKIEVNPSYVVEPGQERSDSALIRLAVPVDGVAPTSINRIQRVPVGFPGTIVGFGQESFDDAVGGEFLGIKRSGSMATSTCPGPTAEDPGVPANFNVCWNFTGGLSNGCVGDAGGPVLVNAGSTPLVGGVISRGLNISCLAPDLSWSTEVFADQNWIDSKGGSDLLKTSCGVLAQAGKQGATILGASTELSGSVTQQRYNFDVPAGTGLLRLAIHGEEFRADPNPDFNLYLRAGAPAETNAFDCRSNSVGLVEYCEIQAPAAGQWHVLVDRIQGAGRFQAIATIYAISAEVCTPNAETLCIDNNPGDRRFKVTMTYSSPPRSVSGTGKAVSLSSLGVARGGLFYFFGVDNPEVLVKVLDGCTINNRRWVYLTAGTDIGYELFVTDTTTGVMKPYTNPDLKAALPVQDINAFTCN
jgi:Trypsin/Bacterial pre-peptidase C-terminal domain